jgi:hypothetical protein
MTTIRNDARTASTNAIPPKTTTPTTVTASTTGGGGVEPMPTTSSAPAATMRRLSAGELARLANAIDTTSSTWWASENDRSELMSSLARLPAADFRALMSDPTRAHNVLSVLDGDDRATVLEMMVNKGAVSVQPGATTTMTSPHAPAPPRSPALLRDDVHAPPATRRAILDENLARVAAYNDDYAAYRDAYQHAVEDARDVGGLRDLGPIAPPSLPSNLPGAPLQGDANRTYLDARGRNDVDRATAQLVADRFRRLTGREVAGMSFSAEAEASVRLGAKDGAKVELGLRREATLGPDGELDVDNEATVKAGLKHATANAGLHGPALDADKVGIEVVDLHGNGVTVSDEGVALKGTFGGVMGKAGFGGDRMSFGIGAEEELHVAGLDAKVEASVSVGLQGVTAEDAAMFVSTAATGFFDTPPELTRGKAWSSLPAVVRADYERQGWTAAEWTKKADLARFTRRAA